MSDQYLGEIRAFGFNFAPYGWFLCNGQILPISGYTALFSLIGTYYGGNGTTNFALPNLQGSVPMHWGTSTSGSVYDLGEITGSTNVTLNSNQLPQHTHNIQVAHPAGGTQQATGTPTAATWLGESTAASAYATSGPTNTNLSQKAIGPNSSGNLPHENMQPFLTINFCIAYQGAFPPRG
jgi:microcystin-dependent protein